MIDKKKSIRKKAEAIVALQDDKTLDEIENLSRQETKKLVTPMSRSLKSA